MNLLASTAMVAALSIFAPQCSSTVDEPAVRITEQIQYGIAMGDVFMPWYDYSDTSQVIQQNAIDQCVGAVLFWKFEDVRIFAAHNVSCPREASFRNSLVVDHVMIDNVRYNLFTRQQYPALGQELVFPFDVHNTDAVGLQTSTGANVVTVSWFVRS